MKTPKMKERNLTRFEWAMMCKVFNVARNGLTTEQKFVGGNGISIARNPAFVAARDEPHAASFHRHIRKRDP